MKNTEEEKINEKAFWAMYLNMAINNLLTIVQYLGGKEIGTKEDKGANGITDSKVITTLRGKKLWEAERLMRKLLKRLPFLGVFKKYQEEPPKSKKGKTSNTQEDRKELRQVDASEIANFLCYVSNLLYEMRNYCSHMEHKPYSLTVIKGMASDDSKKYLYFIEKIYDAAITTTKERFYSDKANESEKIIFNVFRRQSGKPQENIDGRMTSPLNPKCAFKFYEDKESCFTNAGMAFFIALFLEPAHANNMLSDQIIRNSLLSNRKKLNEEQLKAYKRVFSIHCIRLPRLRIESERKMTNETLGMDIVNELHKCPKDLFELLSPEDQCRFRSVDDFKHEILFKRFDDRFPYLCLNYLDRNEVLGSIRFQIDMGYYWFDCYTKSLIDGTRIEDRRLGKRILVFNRIQEAIDRYQAERTAENTLYWSTETGETPPKEYRVDMMPQYYIVRNSIGISFMEKKNENTVFEGKKTRNSKPSCFLSIYELPIMTFLVFHNMKKKIQETIKNFCKNWRDFCNTISETGIVPNPADYGLNLKDIPDEFVWFYKNKSVKPFDLKNVTKFIKGEIDKTDRLINNLKKEQLYSHKIGKVAARRKYTSGRIANMMIRELLIYQPANENVKGGGKITSPNFDVLRASLATFDHTKDNCLCRCFKEAKLLNNKYYPHPFLDKLLTGNLASISIITFFMNYLKKKVLFLQNMKDKIDTKGLPSRDDEEKSFYILRHFIKRQEAAKASPHEYISKIAKRLLEEPVNLPRNLFEPLVREVLMTDFNDEYQKTCAPPNRCNSTFMIMKYHEWSSDAYQWFYDLHLSKTAKKFKKIFALLPGDPDGNSRRLLKDCIQKKKGKEQQILSALLSSFDNVEKDLRHEKLRDIVLIEMARQLLNLPTLKLSDIREKSNLLGQFRQLDYSIKVPGKMREYKDEKLKSDMECRIVGEMKLKNYGNFQRMINDIRFPSYMRLLRDFLGTTDIDYNILRDEFDQFDSGRRKIFTMVIKLEHAILHKYPNLNNELCKEKGENDDYIGFGALVSNVPELSDIWLAITIARNAFAHSYYPEFLEQKNLDNDKSLTPEQVVRIRAVLKSQREKICTMTKLAFEQNDRAPMTNVILNVIKNLFESATIQMGNSSQR